MANYTFTTNTKQEGILDKIRVKQTKKYKDNNEMLQATFTDWIKSWKKSLNIEDVGVIKSALDDKWDDITQVQRDQIKSILGV